MDSQATAIYDFLTRLDSHDISVRRQAHQAAKEALTSNMVAYLLQLLMYCRDAANQPRDPRHRAIALLLETVALDPLAEDFDIAVREQLQSRWKAAPQEDRHEAKFELLSTLASEEREVRIIAARLIASIASFELPDNAWPELIQTLSRAADTERETNFEAAIMTFSFITQELSHSPGMAQSLLGSTNILLNAACKGISHGNPILQSYAVNTIFYSLELLGGHMGELAQRDYLLGVLCTAAGSSMIASPDATATGTATTTSNGTTVDSSSPLLDNLLVKEQAMSCLVKLAYLFYEKLGRYKLDLVRITREAIAQRVNPDRRARHDAQMQKECAAFADHIKGGSVKEAAAMHAAVDAANRVCLEALQFWATVCTAEKEVREGISGRGSLDFSAAALKPLGITGPMLGSFGSGGISGSSSMSGSFTTSPGVSTSFGSGGGGSAAATSPSAQSRQAKKEMEADRSKTLVDLLLQALLMQPETMAIVESERQNAANKQQPGSKSKTGTSPMTPSSGANSSSKGGAGVKVSAAASKALLMLSQATGDRIIDKVMPFVQARIEHKDWHSQEAACMAFGCIIYGPDPIVFREKVSALIGPLLELIRSMNPVTADTAAWCVALVCDQFADVFVQVEGAMDSLLNGVNSMFRRESATALRAAQIVHNLSLQFEDEDDPDGKRRRGDYNNGPGAGADDLLAGSLLYSDASVVLGGSGDYNRTSSMGAGAGTGGNGAGGEHSHQWKDSRLLLVNYGIFVDLLRTSIDQEGGSLRMEAQEALNALIGAAAPEEKIILTLEELLVELVRKAEEFFMLVRQESYPKVEGETFIGLVCNGISRVIRKLGRWRPVALSKHCGKVLDLVLLLLEGVVQTPQDQAAAAAGGAASPGGDVHHLRGTEHHHHAPAHLHQSVNRAQNLVPTAGGGDAASASQAQGVNSSSNNNSASAAGLTVKVEALQLFGSLAGAIGRELLDNVALSGPGTAANHGAGYGRLQFQLERLFTIIDAALKRGHHDEQLCIAAVAALSDVIPGSGPSFASSHLCLITLQNFETLLRSTRVSIDIKCAVLGCLGDLCQYTGGQFRAVGSLMDLVLLNLEEKEARNLQRLGGMKVSDRDSRKGPEDEQYGQYPSAFTQSHQRSGASTSKPHPAQVSKAAASSGGSGTAATTAELEAAATHHNKKIMEKAVTLENQQQSATTNLHYACDLHESICHFLIGIFQGFKGNLDPLQGYVTRSIKLAAKIAREYTTLISGKDRYPEEVIRSAVTLLGFIANAVGQEDMNRLMQWKQDLVLEVSEQGRGGGGGVLSLVSDSSSYGSEAVQEAVRFTRDEIDHVVGL